MPIVTMALPVNIFLIALVTKGYDLPKTTIGFLTSLPFISNFCQVFVSRALLAWARPKSVTVLFASLHAVSWLVLGFMLPWIPRSDPHLASVCLIIWFFISSFLVAIAGVSWNAWIEEWVPPRLRGKYFGRRNGMLQISTLLFLLSTGWVLAQWDYAIPVFQGVIFAAVFLRIFSLRWQWRTPTRVYRPRIVPKISFREQFSVVIKSKSFLIFIAFGSLWSFAANCFGPFYHVFMFEEVGMSSFQIGLLSTLSALGGALSMPAWGRLLDRYGNKSVMTISLLLWQLSSFTWAFIGFENREWLFPLWAWGGVSSAGFVLGLFTLLLKLVPGAAKGLALGLNLAVTSAVAAVAPIAGGEVLTWALERWPDAEKVYHICFLFQPTLAILACFLLLKIQEPRASPITMVFGAMRNVRTLSGVLGLDYLVNYVFYRAPKR